MARTSPVCPTRRMRRANAVPWEGKVCTSSIINHGEYKVYYTYLHLRLSVHRAFMQEAELSGSSADAPVMQRGTAQLPVSLVVDCGRSISIAASLPTHMQLSGLHLPRNTHLLLSIGKVGWVMGSGCTKFDVAHTLVDRS